MYDFLQKEFYHDLLDFYHFGRKLNPETVCFQANHFQYIVDFWRMY